MSSVMSRTANALPPAVRSAKSTSAPVGWICPAAIASRTRSDGRRKDDQSYLCRVLRGRYRAAETRLRGWPCRTRTRKCRFFVISGELLGFTEHFRIRDFSRTPRRDRCKSRWVKATFASSSPICPATQSVSSAQYDLAQLAVITFGCVISEQFARTKYRQYLGWLDALGILNS